MTELYNLRPEWLRLAHLRIDQAAAQAYGWPAGLDDDEVLGRLFDLNRQRSRA